MPSQKGSSPLSLAAVAIAVAAVAMHYAVNVFSPYEFHRDEFLYFAMGEHLRFWGMDFPPLIGVIAQYSRLWFGDTLAATRFFPAVAGGLLILVAVDACRRFGGGAFAQVLTAVSMLASGMFLRTASLFMPVIFDQLWWTLGLWCLLRWRQSGANSWWIALGCVMGIGLLTKFSILFFGFGVLVGLLATSERRLLVTRWPWIALALTLAIGAPSIIGQIRLGFPVTGQIDNLRTYQLVHVSFGDFVGGQFLNLCAAAAAAIAGISALFFSKNFSSYRIIAWTFLGTFSILLFTHGKPYYVGGIYPVMIAAGAVVFERIGSGRTALVFRRTLLAVVILSGLVIVPFGLPVLPPTPMAQHARKLGITAAVTTNRATTLRLPQDYADMLGWNERVDAIAQIYRTLTPAQRADAVIIAGNYGEAGAVDFLGPKFGLPHALCTSGTYWFFGPGQKPGRVAITIGCDAPSLKRNWRRVTPVGHLTNAWAVEEEQDLTFYLCEDEVSTVQSVWHLFEGRN